MKGAGLFSLEGRTALITGAARGIGRSMAAALAEAGADVVLADVLGDQVNETAAVIEETTGQRAVAECVDLADVEAAINLASKARESLGRLDILLNNAAATVRKSFLDITPGEFDRVMAVNARASFFLSQAAAQIMIDQGQGGKIINMASLSSEIGIRDITAYGVSKGGIYALTKGLAVELAPYNIQVNGIAPGFFATDLTAPVWRDDTRRPAIESRIPLGRLGRPEDAAGTVVYLASQASAYLTGRVIFLDGGWMAS